MVIKAKPNFRMSAAHAGYSLRELAEKTGLARESVCRTAHGRPVQARTARKLCEALNAEFDDLFVIEEEAHGKTDL